MDQVCFTDLEPLQGSEKFGLRNDLHIALLERSAHFTAASSQCSDRGVAIANSGSSHTLLLYVSFEHGPYYLWYCDFDSFLCLLLVLSLVHESLSGEPIHDSDTFGVELPEVDAFNRGHQLVARVVVLMDPHG